MHKPVLAALYVVLVSIPAADAPSALGTEADRAPCVAARRRADGARLIHAPNRPDAILSARVETPVVGIGIDDGPHPTWTPQMLDTLARHNAKATFFVVGEHARQYPGLLQAIAAAGHEIALHSDTHHPVEGRPAPEIAADLDSSTQAIRDAGVAPAALFRPPHGLQDLVGAESVCRHGLRTVGWLINVNELTRARMDSLQPGAIVLAHDGRRDRSLDVAELDRLLGHLAARGIHGTSIGDLLAAAGLTPAG